MSFGEFFDAWLMLGFLNMVKNSLSSFGWERHIDGVNVVVVVVGGGGQCSLKNGLMALVHAYICPQFHGRAPYIILMKPIVTRAC